MKRQRSEARKQDYRDISGRDSVIGLRAVAAAIRYQGEANNAQRSPSGETLPRAVAVTEPRDT
jgi:hypothetical protein